MQILHVSSFAPPHLGGLETCAEGLVRELVESGLSIQWLFSDVPHLEPAPNTVRINVWNAAEKRFGIPIPIPKPSGIRRIWECVRAADLVHVHDVMYLTSFWAVVFARLLKKPAVITLHIWKVPYGSIMIRGLQDVAHRFLGQFCLRSASAVVTYNRKIFNLARRCLGKDRVYFIPNGIGRPFIKQGFEVSPEAQSDLRARLGFPLNRKIAVFAGRFVEKKGLSRIKSVAKRFPDVLFLFCGRGPDDPAAWGFGNVTVLGQKTALQLRELFFASDLLLLPSVGEGFPLVIQEAMACGLPCLVLEETWASWGRDKSFFVVTSNDTLEADFGSYLNNPFPAPFRQELQDFSIATWNWKASAAQYQRIYETFFKSQDLECIVRVNE